MAKPGQKNRSLLCLLLCLLLSISYIPMVSAKNLSSMSLAELLEVKIISSATKFDTSINETPASATIVTSDDIETYGYHTLADVLAAERSFYLAYDRNYTYIGSRGFARSGDYNRRVLILIDGFRMNDGYYQQGFVGTPFPIDMDIVERIEIVRGSNSALFGANAILSVVNVVTKKSLNQSQSEVALSYGSQNTHKARVSWFGSDEASEVPNQWALSLSRYQSDGETKLYFPEFDNPQTNNGLSIDNDSDDVWQFYGQYTRKNLRISGYHSQREKAIPTASFGTLFNANNGFTLDEKSQLNIEYVVELNSGITSSTRAYLDHYYYTGDYIYDYPPITINRDLTEVYSRAVEQQFSVYNGKHHWSAGIEYRDDWRYLGQNFDVEPYLLYVNNKGANSRSAVYLQDEYTVSKQWSFLFGARFDDYQIFGSTLNPKFAVTYNYSADARFKFLAGRAFRAPSIPEQAKARRQQDPVLLTPEINHNLELIFEYASSENSQFLFSVYQNRGTDTINIGATSSTGIGFINAKDEATSTGFETEYLFRDFEGTQFSASYGHISSSDNDEIVAVNSPEHLLKVKLAKDFSDDWRVGLNGQYMSKRKTASGNMVDSFFLANLSVNYLGFKTDGWRIQAVMDNIFDESYADPPSTNFLQTGIEQNGRSFRVTAEWQF